MKNLTRKLSQIHSLASAAHSIIYMIADMRWEINVSVCFIDAIEKVCDAISKFTDEVSVEFEKSLGKEE